MTFIQAPKAVTVTDAIGNALLGSGTGGFVAAPMAIVLTDQVGTQLTVSTGQQQIDFGVLPNLTFQNINVENASSGDVNLFTVPTGKRAFCFISLYNPTAGTIVQFPEVSLDGGVTWNRINAGTTIAATGASALQTLSYFFGIALEAGQSFGENFAAPGVHVFGSVYIFDNTANYKTVILASGWIVGNNTLYTCPAGKHAKLAGNRNFIAPGFNVGGEVAVENNSGGSVTYQYHIVQSGGSVTTNNLIATPAALANNTAQGNNVDFCLNPGDSIVINSTSNGAQFAWVNLIEF